MSSGDTLGELATHFAMLSLIAIGGAQTVIPEMHRQAVDIARWTTASEFADLFAISQASPGPNMLIVALIGWKAAGLAGALVATAGMCGPSCALTYVVNRVWHRFRATRWRAAVQAGLAPVTIGIVLASGYILTRAADHSLAAYLLTAATAVGLLMTRLNPLWYLAGGGVLGLFGVV